MPVGVVAHGGNDDSTAKPEYRRMVLDPISDALQTAMLDIVDGGGGNTNGIVFLPEKSGESPESVFPAQTYDWGQIEEDLRPLVVNVMARTATGH